MKETYFGLGVMTAVCVASWTMAQMIATSTGRPRRLPEAVRKYGPWMLVGLATAASAWLEAQ